MCPRCPQIPGRSARSGRSWRRSGRRPMVLPGPPARVVPVPDLYRGPSGVHGWHLARRRARSLWFQGGSRRTDGRRRQSTAVGPVRARLMGRSVSPLPRWTPWLRGQLGAGSGKGAAGSWRAPNGPSAARWVQDFGKLKATRGQARPSSRRPGGPRRQPPRLPRGLPRRREGVPDRGERAGAAGFERGLLAAHRHDVPRKGVAAAGRSTRAPPCPLVVRPLPALDFNRLGSKAGDSTGKDGTAVMRAPRASPGRPRHPMGARYSHSPRPGDGLRRTCAPPAR